MVPPFVGKLLTLSNMRTMTTFFVVWAGEFHPRPNPKPDVQVSKHPAFQMSLSDKAFSGQLPHSSRTLPISESFGHPKQNILPPFAMWLTFPTSDYYGGSATRPPHR